MQTVDKVDKEDDRPNRTGGDKRSLNLPDYCPSPEQERQLQMLLTLLSRCQESGVKVLVTGGYAIDALCGRLTRDHHDFDLYLEEASRGKFEEIIKELGFSPTVEKVGQIEKSASINASFSPPLRLEFGTIEQAISLTEKIYGPVDANTIEVFVPKTPIGSLNGQPIWTPTLAGLKKMAEINDLVFKRSGGPEYPHREWQEQIFRALESRGLP